MIKNPITVCPVNFNNLNVTQNDVLQGVTFVDSNKQVQTGVIETYQGSTDITPDNTIQTLSTNGKYMTSDITVQASGGGASLNVEYGITEPVDTTKLWIKTSEPDEIEISSGVSGGGGDFTFISAGSLPNTIQCASACDGINIYLFSNNNSGTGIYIYNIATQQITLSNAVLPRASVYFYAHYYNGKIYIACRYSNFTSYIYDIATDTISTLSTNINNNQNAGIIGVGKYIYSIGGHDGYYTYYTYIDRYDIENNTRTRVGNLPNGMYNTSSCNVGDDIYIFGGSASGYQNYNIYKLDTITNILTTLKDISPTIIDPSVCFEINSEIHIYRNGTNQYKYSITDNTLIALTSSDLQFPFSPLSITPQKINSNYYFAGFSSTALIYRLPYEVPLTENKLLLTYLQYGTFNIINEDTIKVKIKPLDCYKGNSSNIGEQVKIALYDTDTSSWVEIN